MVAKYNTSDFSLIGQLFSDKEWFLLSDIEYDKKTDSYYVLVILYSLETKMAYKWFISRLINDELVDIRYVTQSDKDFYGEVNRLKKLALLKKHFNGHHSDIKRNMMINIKLV